MTDTVPTTPNSSHRLYHVLAITGIAVGVFVIAAGLYLLIANPSCPMNMSDMKMMEQRMDMPSISPMPSMSPIPNGPVPTPTR